MMPADVARTGGHPAPFPSKLPGRLIRLYTKGACPGFAGDVVLDPFVGTGTTCTVAQAMGRRWVGIDINPAYIAAAADRLAKAEEPPVLEVGRPRWPSKAELELAKPPKLSSEEAIAKHRRATFGRGAA